MSFALAMKKFFLGLISLLLILFVAVNIVGAQEKQINLYFFWGDGCPHCESEREFLVQLSDKYPRLKVHSYEVWYDKTNYKYLDEIASRLEVNVSHVPFTVLGDEIYQGFNNSTISQSIENRVDYCSVNECPDSVSKIVGLSDTIPVKGDPITQEKKFTLPKITSLPIFTISLGLLDGFNPCAMWTLLFLISLLLGMKEQKKRWILGIAFILTSAFVYFLFMTAWLKLILFLGFIVWIRIFIGLVAVGGGGYNLREYFVNKNVVCKVTGGNKRQLFFENLRKIIGRKQFVLSLIGIIILAFVVNVVELVCSAGLPVVFTQVLSLSNLLPWQYYGYMLLYIFFFMLDDLFVFVVAMVTLQATGINTKYSRLSHLIGGIAMLIIGLLLIFKPELLMFG